MNLDQILRVGCDISVTVAIKLIPKTVSRPIAIPPLKQKFPLVYSMLMHTMAGNHGVADGAGRTGTAGPRKIHDNCRGSPARLVRPRGQTGRNRLRRLHISKKCETGRASKARTISRARIPTQAESWCDTNGGWCRRSAGARIVGHVRMIYRREIRFRHCHSNGVDHVQVSSAYGDSHRARRCSSRVFGVRPGRARKGGDPRPGAGYGSFDAVASPGRASSAKTLRPAAGAGAQPGGGRAPR
jgi:hypothetical protein